MQTETVDAFGERWSRSASHQLRTNTTRFYHWSASTWKRILRNPDTNCRWCVINAGKSYLDFLSHVAPWDVLGVGKTWTTNTFNASRGYVQMWLKLPTFVGLLCSATKSCKNAPICFLIFVHPSVCNNSTTAQRCYINFDIGCCNSNLSTMLFWVVTPCRLVSKPWRWTQYFSPKRWYLPKSLHGVTIRKTSIQIFHKSKYSLRHFKFKGTLSTWITCLLFLYIRQRRVKANLHTGRHNHFLVAPTRVFESKHPQGEYSSPHRVPWTHSLKLRLPLHVFCAVTCSRVQHKRIYQNRILTKMFGHKKERTTEQESYCKRRPCNFFTWIDNDHVRYKVVTAVSMAMFF
jgi:hypothetical protein